MPRQPSDIANGHVNIDSDSPTETDELGRERYVRTLTHIIRTADTPLVVAIYGAWGTGKTSLMMQLRRSVDPTHDRSDNDMHRSQTVWFDPWMHQFDDSPALGLLHAAADQLDLTTNRRVVSALSRIAIALGEDIQLPFIGVRLGRILRIRDEIARDDFNRAEERARLREHFHDVLAAARGAGSDDRIVFFIDDLDRCQPKVALALLEALKLYLDLPGCVYVLGVDRGPLEAAVKSEYSGLELHAQSYLDKIIQLPFAIPPIDRDVMYSFVESRLPSELTGCVSMVSEAAMDEPRNVKRVVNSLLVNHQLATATAFPGGYEPRVLAMLVLIQTLAPDLYRQLRHSPSLIHELFESLRRIEEDEYETLDSNLWHLYVSPNLRLDKSLRAFDIPADMDLTPYVTLTSVSSTDGDQLLDPSGNAILLTYYEDAVVSAGLVRQFAAALRGFYWEVVTQTASAVSQKSLRGVVGVVAIIGPSWAAWSDLLAPTSDGVRPLGVDVLQHALEGGVPLVPVKIEDEPEHVTDPNARRSKITKYESFYGIEPLQVERSEIDQGIRKLHILLTELAKRPTRS